MNNSLSDGLPEARRVGLDRRHQMTEPPAAQWPIIGLLVLLRHPDGGVQVAASGDVQQVTFNTVLERDPFNAFHPDHYEVGQIPPMSQRLELEAQMRSVAWAFGDTLQQALNVLVTESSVTDQWG